MEQIKVKKLTRLAKLPVYSSEYAAAADLFCAEEANITVKAGETVLIHTGIAMEIPAGYAGFIYARSGLATKRGLAPANKVGVIDSDYRGQVMVSLHNHTDQPQFVDVGERVAQIVFAPVYQAQFCEVETLQETERGTGGFGSTGTK